MMVGSDPNASIKCLIGFDSEKLAEGAVPSELFSGSNSLFSGKIQGKRIRRTGPNGTLWLEISALGRLQENLTGNFLARIRERMGKPKLRQLLTRLVQAGALAALMLFRRSLGRRLSTDRGTAL